MTTRPGLTLAIATALIVLASPALAGREIVVNGDAISTEEAADLDRLACARIPDGRYWLTENGAWGYEGNPYRMGFLGEQCVRAQAPPRKSLSERGLLYSPGELLRD